MFSRSSINIRSRQALRVALALSGGAVFAAPADLPPPPELSVPVCAAPPALDGMLDDACWEKAAFIERLYLFGKDGTGDAASFRLARDDQWLYLAVRIKHPRPESIQPRIRERDGSVHQDDSIEIFADPGTDGRLYYHYILNAANVRAEQQKTRQAGGDYHTDRQWDLPWRSAARVTDTGWQAEIALPLSVLGAHGVLEKLRLNLCVNLVVPVIDPMGQLAHYERVSLIWSPVFSQFHEPFRFAHIQGLESVRPHPPFLAALRQASAGHYVQTNGAYGYLIRAELHALTPVEQAVEITAVDRPLGADPARVSASLTVKGPAVYPVELFVPAATLASRTAELELRAAGSGEILQVEYLADTGHLNLLSDVYPDRSYYTTESAARVRGIVALPAAALREMSAEVRDAGGKRLGAADRLTAAPEVKVSLADVPDGSHRWSLTLLNADGQALIRREFDLFKRAPRPGYEFKVDRFEGVVLRDGVPFLPYGMIMYGIHGDNEAPFEMAASMGFNSAARWVRTPPDKALVFHDTAARHGLLAVENPGNFAAASLTHLKGRDNFTELFQEQSENIAAGLRAIKDSPHWLGCSSLDEPTGRQVAAGRILHRMVREMDGYRPVWVIYGSDIGGFPPEMTDWTDIIGIDPYWTPSGDAIRGLRGTVNWVSKCTWIAARRARAEGKALFVTPMAELYSGVRKRVLLPRELFCQAYLALIHGARGFQYFRWPLYHQASVDAHRELGRQIRELAPSITAPALPQEIAYTPAAFDPENEKFPDVQVVLLRRPAGGLTLLAANSRPYPVDATFKIAGVDVRQPVSRLFADATCAVSSNVFADRLECLGTRAYVIAAAPAAEDAPIRLSVETRPWPDQADPMYAEAGYPDSGRPGRRNIVQNPSFESASLPAWPDYYIWLNARAPPPPAGNPLDFNLIGTESALIAQDTNAAWHGAASLRMASAADEPRHFFNRWHGFSFTLVPNTTQPTRYVYSAYMKADRTGVVARLAGLDAAAGEDTAMPEFELTTAWARYEQSGVLAPSINRYHQFGIRVYGKGTVWVDALQVEKGAAPTEFDP